MPTKLKPSQKKFVRGGNPANAPIEHFYIKSTAKEELFKMLNASNTKPKVKQKIRNELVRRGIKIVWKAKDE
jgi:hypothetical protein|tara:strand:- start:1340 stop:1555 length:216 start_codon:yes stop_codon:yes gene_type:complete